MDTEASDRKAQQDAGTRRRPRWPVWLIVAVVIIAALAWSWDWLATAGLLGVTLLLLGCLGMCVIGMLGRKSHIHHRD